MFSLPVIVTASFSLNICQTASGNDRLNNTGRVFTIAIDTMAIEDITYKSRLMLLESLIYSWTGNVMDCYLLHSFCLYITSVLIDRSQVLSVLNDSNEELDNQMVSKDFGGTRNEGASLAQQGFVDANDEESSGTSHKMV